MRKIDKRQCLATEYETWLEEEYPKWLENYRTKGTNPPYKSSNHPHYQAIIAALLYCQNGLCAYTEYKILNANKVSEIPNLFNNLGKYIGKRFETPDDLEHFESEDKSQNPWNWTNLFSVYSPINHEKEMRERKMRKDLGKENVIDNILKPDLGTYNPFKFLEYDLDSHKFYANSEIFDDSISERIENMIYILGLNWGDIVDKREEYLNPLIEDLKSGKIITPIKFITAYEMLKRQLLLP